MANLLLQVTIPASGKVQVSSGFTSPPNGIPTASTGNAVGNIFVQFLLFQNNATHSIRYGDVTVSSTRGILLTTAGAGSQTTPINYGTYLSDWWIAGTSGDVIDVLYIQ